MTSDILFSDSTGYWNKTGSKVRADGWFGNGDGIHTISINVRQFIGRLYLQGTLATDPSENDWFDIKLPNQIYNYIEYPRTEPNAPNGGETSVLGFNFDFNVTWLRLRLDRSYLDFEPNPSEYENYGSVIKVLLAT